MQLPTRTPDTMSDAIAMSSPNGRMSKRSKDAATARLSLAIFGTSNVTREMIMGKAPESTPAERAQRLRQRAKDLRHYASCGMKPRVYAKEAQRLEDEAAALDGGAL